MFTIHKMETLKYIQENLEKKQKRVTEQITKASKATKATINRNET